MQRNLPIHTVDRRGKVWQWCPWCIQWVGIHIAYVECEISAEKYHEDIKHVL